MHNYKAHESMKAELSANDNLLEKSQSISENFNMRYLFTVFFIIFIEINWTEDYSITPLTFVYIKWFLQPTFPNRHI